MDRVNHDTGNICIMYKVWEIIILCRNQISELIAMQKDTAGEMIWGEKKQHSETPKFSLLPGIYASLGIPRNKL